MKAVRRKGAYSSIVVEKTYEDEKEDAFGRSPAKKNTGFSRNNANSSPNK